VEPLTYFPPRRSNGEILQIGGIPLLEYLFDSTIMRIKRKPGTRINPKIAAKIGTFDSIDVLIDSELKTLERVKCPRSTIAPETNHHAKRFPRNAHIGRFQEGTINSERQNSERAKSSLRPVDKSAHGVKFFLKPFYSQGISPLQGRTCGAQQ